VPIAIVASADGLDAAKLAYGRLLSSVESSYHEAAAHYRRLREELTAIETPDETVNLAFEWGKVALDKGFVCNPQLGCGLIAGLGPSGNTERPGFGWFFGGDAFMNAWAITAYGDFATVKQTLEFLRERQRADGKMMHELSQGAAYLRWFEDFPYGYYHADTTALYIIAVRDYVRASGDTAFAKAFWPSIRKAYDYCMSTDEDGDGLMDNTRAGLAAVETGKLRRADVLTDVYLASAWTEAADAAAEVAEVAGDPFAATAHAAHDKARASLQARFLDPERKRIVFAWMKSGRGDIEPTAWTAFGLWRQVFDEARPEVSSALDELAGSGIGTDWGTRMLSRQSDAYEPQSYNNGAVWPFLTGFTTLALYAHHRPDAAWQYLRASADLAFIETRGYTPEVFSGDRLRSLDQAVPHQLFSTSGFVSGMLRGLAGLREPSSLDSGAPLSLSPQLPSRWSWLRMHRVRWRDAVYDISIVGEAGGIDVSVSNAGQTRPLEVTLRLEPGATVAHGTAAVRFTGRAGPETAHLSVKPGITIDPVDEPLRTGDVAKRLRILRTSFEAGHYVARMQGLTGSTYRVRLRMPFVIAGVEGGTVLDDRGGILEIAVPFEGASNEWIGKDLSIATIRRR
jgi:glycogen debranching enzyme